MFDLLMHEYGWSFYEVKKLTKQQMLLFQKKINTRKMYRDEFIAKVHGLKLKKRGLDTTNAIPIENIFPA